MRSQKNDGHGTASHLTRRGTFCSTNIRSSLMACRLKKLILGTPNQDIPDGHFHFQEGAQPWEVHVHSWLYSSEEHDRKEARNCEIACG